VNLILKSILSSAFIINWSIDDDDDDDNDKQARAFSRHWFNDSIDFDDNKRFCSSSLYHLRINNEDIISRVDDDKSE